jgi:chromosome partitioning protein
MYTIAVLSQKGGSGKTTIAVNLAVVAALRNQATVIIDLDPQASACTWSDNRDKAVPNVSSIQSSRLKKTLQILKEAAASLVFIDNPPATEQAASQSIAHADLIIVPCKPGFLDLAAINHTANLLTAYGKKAWLLFNTVASSKVALKEAQTAATCYQSLMLAPLFISQRVAFSYAMRDGLGVVEYEPHGKAAHEIINLYEFILKELKSCG